MIVLANEDLTKASPLIWKAKQIDRVCHSSKDDETLAMTKMIDELVYMARQVEILLYGDYKKRMNVRIITDSEPTLESIASTRQIERKQLRMVVKEMKDKLSSMIWKISTLTCLQPPKVGLLTKSAAEQATSLLKMAAGMSKLRTKMTAISCDL